MDPLTASLILGGASSATDIGGQLLSGYQGRKSAKRAAKYARWNSAWAAQNLPSLQMEGLRKGGLNPILAAGNVGKNYQVGAGSPGPIGQSGGGADYSRGYQSVSSAKLAKEQRNTQREMTRYYGNMADREHWRAISSSVDAYKDKLLSKAYDNPAVQRTAPFLRAYSESGLPASSAMQLFNNFTRFHGGKKK